VELLRRSEVKGKFVCVGNPNKQGGLPLKLQQIPLQIREISRGRFSDAAQVNKVRH